MLVISTIHSINHQFAIHIDSDLENVHFLPFPLFFPSNDLLHRHSCFCSWMQRHISNNLKDVYGMEVSSSNVLTYDTEEKALKGLFDAFGSTFTLQEIAFAYCNSGWNAELVGEFLYDKRTSTSTSSTNSSDGETKGKESLEISYDNISQNQSHENEKFKVAKKKWRPVSGGSVSSVIGKDYFKPTLPANGSCVATKLLKLDSKELPMSAIWGEEVTLEPSKDGHLHKDMEDFLFKMLGEGFQMNKNVIREVLVSTDTMTGLLVHCG